MAEKITNETFLIRVKEKHGDNKYDYSNTVYINNKSNITVKCQEHGEFTQRAGHHLNGSGCPSCAGNKKKTTESYINEANIKHDYGYNYSEVEYKGAFEKINIICLEHGLFSQEAKAHLTGQGCPKCAGNARKTTDEIIVEFRLIHGDKFDYTKVEFISMHKHVLIGCKMHGFFKQSSSNHLSGHNCPKCRGLYKTNEEYIKEVDIIHDYKYDYSETEYLGTYVKIKIKCPEHGFFEQEPGNHLSGQGCPKCANNVLYTTEEYIDKSNITHDYRYSYEKTDYKGNKKDIIITCKEHGDFVQNPTGHLYGKGYQKCAKNHRYNTEEIIIEFNKMHGDLYDYTKVEYTKSREPVIIVCKKHGEFLQSPNSHLQNHGCQKCCYSKGEYAVAKFLDENDILYETQYKFEKCKYINELPFDFYLPEFNTCIEFNGEQHYRPVEFFGGEEAFKLNLVRDNIKKNFCKETDKELIIIKYDENIQDKLNFWLLFAEKLYNTQ